MVVVLFPGEEGVECWSIWFEWKLCGVVGRCNLVEVLTWWGYENTTNESMTRGEWRWDSADEDWVKVSWSEIVWLRNVLKILQKLPQQREYYS